MTKKDFITGMEFSAKQLQEIIDLAISFKKGKVPQHAERIITLFFANPSLRTRLSFESGMKKMQGKVNVLSGNDTWNFEYREGAVMNADKQEHIKEAAQVISKYTDLLAIRKSELITTKSDQSDSNWNELKKDEAIATLAKYATVPVINMESNMFHPCQALADIMTMIEQFKSIKNKKYVLTWAPHPKPLPLATPHSQLLMPAMFGMDVTLAHPPSFNLDEDVIKLAKAQAKESGGSLQITQDQEKALKNADVVMAKSWASLKYFGDWQKETKHRNKFKNWIIDNEKMSLTNEAIFMHCLPVRRNVVVSDEVLDSGKSIIIQEAENRMWAQMALMHYLLTLKS
ncbi:MAG: N-acetylornithine carbamoyltransferase [Candidatus Peregrinibacteria bacterium]|nr:N-acetylornithine carbamoyltransferase [Candidatus Peregrinibacteria bacterium]